LKIDGKMAKRIIKKVVKKEMKKEIVKKTINSGKNKIDGFFKAQNIAVIGAAREPNKIGHIILRNLMANKTVYPVNPNADEIMRLKCYKSVIDIEDKIDLAVIAVKSDLVPQVVIECGKKRIPRVVIISSGFDEIGRTDLSKKLKKALDKYGIAAIGPNCLGIYDSYNEFDGIFLPKQKVKRPEQGGISFISQSGALGATLLDMAAERKYGISKFISYGNAVNLNECDFLEYLVEDENTKVICMYIEQVKDGKRFVELAKRVSKIKPIIVFKGGVTEQGNKATLSHTGSLAGDAQIYQGIFKQTGLVQVDMLEDLFGVAKLFEKILNDKYKINGKRIQIITNGGGYGIISTDNIIKNEMTMAELSANTRKTFEKNLPGISIKNPIDLLGDTTNERYKLAISALLNENNVDMIMIVLLYQTPFLTEDIVDVLSEIDQSKKKPIVVVTSRSSYGNYTNITEKLADKGIVCFEFPEQAARAMGKVLGKIMNH
jgi:acyl-CoA synthetase (NDP forming)